MSSNQEPLFILQEYGEDVLIVRLYQGSKWSGDTLLQPWQALRLVEEDGVEITNDAEALLSELRDLGKV